MDHINESTHRLLITTVEAQAREIEAMALEWGRPLSYARLAMVNKSRDLVRVAKAEARLAGVWVESEAGR